MSYFENDDAIRTMMRRAAVKKVEDEGSQQVVTWTGFKGESGKAYRQQGHGLSTVPPEGSEGYLVALGGRSDKMLFLQGEHEKHRPQTGKAGDTALYDAHGNIVSLVERNVRIVSGGTVTVKAPTIVLEGDVYLGGKDGAKRVATEDTLDSRGGKLQGPFASKAHAL